MAEMETLAEHPPCNCDAAEAAKTALSWLASVLADDATVRTVAEALEDATIQHLGRDLGTAHRDEIAAHALAALSAHLTAPARAGDTSGEEGL